MPILEQETDIFPCDLFELATNEIRFDQQWFALYTRSRREKQLMRHLLAHEIPFYSPVISRRYRSPNGRVRTSYVPLFAGYVFIFGGESQRYNALTSSCISRWMAVSEGRQLTSDLQQIHDLIQLGHPLTPEARLRGGERVRVLSGAFHGFEGQVLRRQNETRLLVAVNFTQQGASVLLDECQLERL